jgi:hypothetical protein
MFHGPWELRWATWAKNNCVSCWNHLTYIRIYTIFRCIMYTIYIYYYIICNRNGTPEWTGIGTFHSNKQTGMTTEMELTSISRPSIHGTGHNLVEYGQPGRGTSNCSPYGLLPTSWSTTSAPSRASKITRPTVLQEVQDLKVLSVLCLVMPGWCLIRLWPPRARKISP